MEAFHLITDALAQFQHTDGTRTYIVRDHHPIDPAADSPMATIIYPTDPSNRNIPTHDDTDTQAALGRAVNQWKHHTNAATMIQRYMRAYWNTHTVQTSHDDIGHTYYGAITHNKVTESGFHDPATIINDELNTYMNYVNGDIYGAVRTDNTGNLIETSWGYTGYPNHAEIARAATGGLAVV